MEEVPPTRPTPNRRSRSWTPGQDRAGGLPTAGSAPAGGLPDEITLHTERPVVSAEVVPIERLRLRLQTVEGRETVTERVQRKQIVADEAPSAGFRRG